MKLIEVNLDKCTGCRLCEMVCSLSHEPECSTAKSRIKIVKDQEFGNNLVQLCIQCYEAPCIESCPLEALYRNEESGVVLLDEATCNGCGICIEACPLGALFFDEERSTVLKCDLCEGDPKCVKVCSTGALIVKDEDIASPTRKSFVEETSKLLWEVVAGERDFQT